MKPTFVTNIAAIRDVLTADTDNFVDLIKIACLSPRDHFRFKVFRKVDFSGCDLSAFDFTGSHFEECSFAGSRLGSAIFVNSRFVRSDRAKAVDWPVPTANSNHKRVGAETTNTDPITEPSHALKKVVALEHALADLARNPDALNWHLHFRATWNEYKGSEELLELALHWLEEQPSYSVVAPLVLQTLLATGSKSAPEKSDEISNVAIRWLERAPVDNQHWVAVWIAAQRAMPKRREIIDLGWSAAKLLLDITLRDRRPEWPVEDRWCRLWIALAQVVGLTPYTISLVETAAQRFSSENFVRRVLLTVYRKGHSETVRKTLLTWLDDTSPEKADWISIYDTLLRSRQDQKRTLSIGLKWMCFEHTQCATWDAIWNASAMRKCDLLLVESANKWLANAESSDGGWPTLLAGMLRHGGGLNDDVREKALRWLTDGPAHRHRSFIAEHSSILSGQTGQVAGDGLRLEAVRALGSAVDARFVRVRGSRFEDTKRHLRAVVLCSRNYKPLKGIDRYWYGFQESADTFLKSKGFVVLVLADTRVAYAIPVVTLRRYLAGLSQTNRVSGAFWHLELQGAAKNMMLKSSGSASPLSLRKFCILGPDSH